MKIVNKIGTAVLGLSLVVGIGAVGSTASAQGRYDQGRYNQGRNGRGNDRGYDNDFRRVADDQGYKDGIWEGSNRAQSRKSFDPYGTNSYKKANDGYNSRMGDKNFFQQSYRQGYLRGYEEGFRREGGRSYRR